ncbi:choice-of-anchor N protein, partial [Thermogutta sp.]
MFGNRGFCLNTLFGSILALAGWVGNGRVLAEPTLQIYLEGGLYDTATQSWYLAPPGSSAGEPFRLWIIGDTSKGPIEEVRLSMAYSSIYRANGVDLAVTITPTTTGGLFGFTDPSTPPPPTFLQYGAEGTQPVLGDGSPLPAHGIYGEGVVWQEWL